MDVVNIPNWEVTLRGITNQSSIFCYIVNFHRNRKKCTKLTTYDKNNIAKQPPFIVSTGSKIFTLTNC